MRKKVKNLPGTLVLLLAAAAALLPGFYLLSGCLANLQGFWLTFLRTPEYLYKFWNSLGICAAITAGQLAVSCMGGLALAKYPLPCRRFLTGFLVIVLLLPLQVTLMPGYLILDRMGLLDTVWALILPLVFSPFGTVIMWMTFRRVPDELADAAQMDGAGVFTLLWKIMVPAGRSGAVSVLLLTFVDAWNMVEQPMVFLRDTSKYPLSVFLASLDREGFSLSFHSGLLSMLPAVLLLFYYREELAEGGGLLLEK